MTLRLSLLRSLAVAQLFAQADDAAFRIACREHLPGLLDQSGAVSD